MKETIVQEMGMKVLQILLNHFLSVWEIETQKRGYVSTNVEVSKMWENSTIGETSFTCSKTVSMEEFLEKDKSAKIFINVM